MGASSSSKMGCEMKISRAFMHRPRISVSKSCTCLPGRLPRTSSRRVIILSTSRSPIFDVEFSLLGSCGQKYVLQPQGYTKTEQESKKDKRKKPSTWMSFPPFISVDDLRVIHRWMTSRVTENGRSKVLALVYVFCFWNHAPQCGNRHSCCLRACWLAPMPCSDQHLHPAPGISWTFCWNLLLPLEHFQDV